MKSTNSTKVACCMGFATTAVVNNYAPLLFSTFQRDYSLTLDKVSILILCNFGFQIIAAMFSGRIDKLGYRKAMVISMSLAVLGLICLSVLPGIFPVPLVGLATGIAIYAIGAGMFNVSVNPVIESTTSKNSDRLRSLLYSSYCWAFVFVVLGSTAFFNLAGVGQWKVLTFIWALFPLAGAILFSIVPMNDPSEKNVPEKAGVSLPLKKMLTENTFIVIMLAIFCGGSAEQAMSQWASAFAEMGLHVSKTTGDLAGPCLFAGMMGVARVLYAMAGERFKLEKTMLICGVMCIISYLLAALSPQPQLAFLGFGLCGFAVAIFWPGSISAAVKHYPAGGPIMFAALTFSGNVGSALGPAVVGVISEALKSINYALLIAMVFPIVFFICQLYFVKKRPIHQ